MRQCLAAFIMIGWLWSAIASKAWAEGDFQRDTLQGLPGVWVVVEHLPPELVQAGVTQSQMQRDTEEKLRRVGITVLTQDECWRTPGMPWLYLTVALLKANETTYAATVAATLNQEVILTRDPRLKTFGVTWDAGVRVGAVSTEQLSTIRQSIGNLVDKFIADYLMINSSSKH